MSNINKRGFASLSTERRKEIAGLGGKAAHKKGVAHTWDHTQAVAAGKKGRKKARVASI
jgi:general stress protein YciG